MVTTLFLLFFLVASFFGIVALVTIAWHLRQVVAVVIVGLAGLALIGAVLLGTFSMRRSVTYGSAQPMMMPSGHFTLGPQFVPFPPMPVQVQMEVTPSESVSAAVVTESTPVSDQGTATPGAGVAGAVSPSATVDESPSVDAAVVVEGSEPSGTPAASATDPQAELHASTEVGDLQTQSVAGTTQDAVEAAPAANATTSVTPAPDSSPVVNTDAPVASASPASDNQVSATPVTTETPSSTPAPPSWVVNPPDRVYNHPAMVLVSDPFETGVECDRDIERLVRHAFQLMANEQCRQLGLVQNISVAVTAEDIAAVLRDRYSELRSTSLGAMRQVHQLVVFDDRVQAKLQRDVRQAMVVQRTQEYGSFGSVVLACVTGLYGLFRIVARRSPDPIAAELLKV